MRPVSELLPDAMLNQLTCKRCGNEVTFAPKQWRKACGRCGLVLTLPKPIVSAEKEQLPPACFICGDQGLVFYQAQDGGNLYDYVAKCICQAGQDRKENYPAVDQVDNVCDLQYLSQENRKAWEKRTGKKADIALLAGTDEVLVDVEEIPF